ncbi:MAG: indole-3-glycerol phosphate synthase TrpC [Syntrophaceae bacterium]|nr:indole-3-glycerol phosphate synthase TrpC [Syntrophaceae bacterium]
MRCPVILDRIVEVKKREVALAKARTPLEVLERSLHGAPPVRDFREALRRNPCAIIAEIKRASPSKGRLCEDFRPREIAAAYESGGAAALSVLTDETFFEGAGVHLAEVRREAGLPVLRKDFVIDEYQIVEARLLGADAVLLIARILEEDRLREYVSRASSLGMSALVEVHGGGELDLALRAGAVLVGINNRDLDTFRTDLTTTLELAPRVPAGMTVVSESGIQTRDDIERLLAAGVHAFLIGEALMKAPDPTMKLKELMGR